MRTTFHQELETIDEKLIGMTQLVQSAMGRATTALLEADDVTAREVISDDNTVDALRREIDEHILRVLATQQPVAGDLRTLVAGLRMDRDLERMGDLARHIAEIAAEDAPRDAVPIQLHGIVHSMNRVALHLAEQVKEAIAFRDRESAAELEREDDEMDTLHAALYKELLASALPMQTALDLALLGRYYERYADHAVAIAESVRFEAAASA
ncbi:phosphate signaling complex protein PhoU [Kutzneria buriramensis]|uniref:Phosphate-specific transport system accessory protein PhoU n=1 Tax=Kutzneria buriramensis TaxID=1045776 RepID=A0A3E0H0C8_9PSEU|nr:phosphate signaling complex protein PhoU [Kutzneria buriramensis]REH34832.1 phosphate transport system protein [Kutzneria buriramensis]